MRPRSVGLAKTTKDAAISALTYGVPTLSISYAGRRQVFVESPVDAEVYQSSYDAIKHYLNSELTLNFIATGVQLPNGHHINTGCSVVRKIVSELRAADAKNIFGLLDWDGENSSGGGIIILAEGERDGLESVLFDPLLLLNALIRNRGSNATQIGLPAGTTYISLSNLQPAALQVAVDELQRRVLGRSRIESFAVKYIGGLELLVDREYVCMDDHELEERVFATFPELKTVARSRAGYMAKWIAQVLMPDRPEHVPVCLLATFSRVLNS